MAPAALHMGFPTDVQLNVSRRSGKPSSQVFSRILTLGEAFGRIQSSSAVSVYSCLVCRLRFAVNPSREVFSWPFRCFPDMSTGISAPLNIFGLGISSSRRGRNLRINFRHLPAPIPFSLSILHTHPIGRPLRVDTDQ